MDFTGNSVNLVSDLSDDNEAMIRSKNLGGQLRSQHMYNSIESQRKSQMKMGNRRSKSLARGALNNYVQEFDFGDRRSTMPSFAGPMITPMMGPPGGFMYPGMMQPVNQSYIVVYGSSPFGQIAGMQLPMA